MNKRVIYLIPGLATDERSYKYLNLGNEDIRHIHWIAHLKGDTLASYALRLLEQIDTSRPVVLIGTSLGAMLAVEISKHIPTEKVILVSGIASRFEQPPYFKFFRNIPLYQWIPDFIFSNVGIWFKFLFQKRRLPASWKGLFTDMFSEHSPRFLKWCMHAALHWDNEHVPENMIRYHGDKDSVFPYKYIHQGIRIPNGSHIMIFTRAKEISHLIQAELEITP